MEGYDFIRNDDSSTDEQTTIDDDFNVRKWSLGEHQEKSPDLAGWEGVENALNNIEDDAPGLADALSDAKETVQTFQVKGFECEICGLNHSHSDTKHDIRSAFNVTDEFAEGMKFSPFCHCGVSELARLVMYFNDVEGVVMFSDQHEFESVLELPAETVRNVYRAMQEVTIDEAREVGMTNFAGPGGRTLNFSEAVEWETERVGSRISVVPVDISGELQDFYDRVNDIRNAASGAPIPSDTEQSLNDTLGEL